VYHDTQQRGGWRRWHTSAALAKRRKDHEKPYKPDDNSDARRFCGKMIHVKMLLQSLNSPL
jgi:hypothetical protein